MKLNTQKTIAEFVQVFKMKLTNMITAMIAKAFKLTLNTPALYQNQSLNQNNQLNLVNH